MLTCQIKEPMRQTLLTCCLDKWALWLDKISGELSTMEQLGKTAVIPKLEEQLECRLIATLQLFTTLQMNDADFANVIERIDSPSSLVKLGLNYATTKRKADLPKAHKCFQQAIAKEPDHAEFAHYYDAFVILKEQSEFKGKLKVRKKLKPPLQKALRAFEAKQISELNRAGIITEISSVVYKKKKQLRTLATGGFYKDQKSASVELYDHFIRSIHDMLGTHRICPDDFDVARFVEPACLSNAELMRFREAIFQRLVENGVIKPCKLKTHLSDNDLQPVASAFGLEMAAFKDYLLNHASVFDEQNGAKKLKGHFPEIPSREAFWKLLRQHKVIEEEEVVALVLVSNKTLGEDLWLDVKAVGEKHWIAKRSLVPSDDADNIILLHPEVDNSDGAYYVFPKEELKEVIGDDWRKEKRRGNVIINKTARVAVDQLMKFIPGGAATPFRLTERCFSSVFPLLISPEKSAQIFHYLCEQWIISSDGDLDVQVFDVDSESELTQLLTRFSAYIAEIWAVLSCRFSYKLELHAMVKFYSEQLHQNPQTQFKLTLPYKPHLELLRTLAQSSSIYVPFRLNKKAFAKIDKTITEKMANSLLQRKHGKAAKGVPQVRINKQYLEYMVEQLKNCHGVLNKETPTPSLMLISEVVSAEQRAKFTTEVSRLNVNGSDHIISVVEKPHSTKTLLRCAAVALIGFAQVSTGAVLQVASGCMSSPVSLSLIQEGIGDIIYASVCAYDGFFSWKAYLATKMLSLAMSPMSLAGIGGWNFAQFENKFSTLSRGPIRQVLKGIAGRIGREAVCSTFKFGTTLAVEKSRNHIVDAVLYKLYKTVDDAIEDHANFKKTLTKAERTLGSDRADRFVMSTLNAALDDKTKKTDEWVDLSRTIATEAQRIVKKMQSSNVLLCDFATSGLQLVPEAVHLALLYTIAKRLLENTSMELNNKLAEMQVSDVSDGPADELFLDNMIEKIQTQVKSRLNQKMRADVESLLQGSMGLLIDLGTSGIRTGLEKTTKAKLDREKMWSEVELTDSSFREDIADNAKTDEPKKELKRKLELFRIQSKGPAFHARRIRQGVQFDVATVQACANVQQQTIVIVDKATGEERFKFSPQNLAKNQLTLRVKVENAYSLGEGGCFNLDGNPVASKDLFETVAGSRKDAVALRSRVADHVMTDRRLHGMLAGYRNRFTMVQGFTGGASQITEASLKNISISPVSNIAQQPLPVRNTIDGMLQSIDTQIQRGELNGRKKAERKCNSGLGNRKQYQTLHLHHEDKLDGLYSAKLKHSRQLSSVATGSILLLKCREKNGTVTDAQVVGLMKDCEDGAKSWSEVVRHNQQRSFLPIRNANGQTVGIPQANSFD